MQTLLDTKANQERVVRLRQALAELLAEGLQPGFFGIISLEASIQDGTIQNLRSRVERLDR